MKGSSPRPFVIRRPNNLYVHGVVARYVPRILREGASLIRGRAPGNIPSYIYIYIYVDNHRHTNIHTVLLLLIKGSERDEVLQIESIYIYIGRRGRKRVMATCIWRYERKRDGCIYVDRENCGGNRIHVYLAVCVQSIPLSVAHKSHPKKLGRKRQTTLVHLFFHSPSAMAVILVVYLGNILKSLRPNLEMFKTILTILHCAVAAAATEARNDRFNNARSTFSRPYLEEDVEEGGEFVTLPYGEYDRQF